MYVGEHNSSPACDLHGFRGVSECVLLGVGFAGGGAQVFLVRCGELAIDAAGLRAGSSVVCRVRNNAGKVQCIYIYICNSSV